MNQPERRNHPAYRADLLALIDVGATVWTTPLTGFTVSELVAITGTTVVVRSAAGFLVELDRYSTSLVVVPS